MTMTEPQIRYDEPSDTLYVSFAPGESATGLELSDHILLRVDKRRRTAIGRSARQPECAEAWNVRQGWNLRATANS